MSHTFHHESSGVRIHYNSDFSGEALVILPDGTEFRVSAAALAEFGSDDEEVEWVLTRWWQVTDAYGVVRRQTSREDEAREALKNYPGGGTLQRLFKRVMGSEWREVPDDA